MFELSSDEAASRWRADVKDGLLASLRKHLQRAKDSAPFDTKTNREFALVVMECSALFWARFYGIDNPIQRCRFEEMAVAEMSKAIDSVFPGFGFIPKDWEMSAGPATPAPQPAAESVIQPMAPDRLHEALDRVRREANGKASETEGEEFVRTWREHEQEVEVARVAYEKEKAWLAHVEELDQEAHHLRLRWLQLSPVRRQRIDERLVDFYSHWKASALAADSWPDSPFGLSHVDLLRMRLLIATAMGPEGDAKP